MQQLIISALQLAHNKKAHGKKRRDYKASKMRKLQISLTDMQYYKYKTTYQTSVFAEG